MIQSSLVRSGVQLPAWPMHRGAHRVWRCKPRTGARSTAQGQLAWWCQVVPTFVWYTVASRHSVVAVGGDDTVIPSAFGSATPCLADASGRAVSRCIGLYSYHDFHADTRRYPRTPHATTDAQHHGTTRMASVTRLLGRTYRFLIVGSWHGSLRCIGARSPPMHRASP